jgi:hypothetical protein
MNGYRRAIREMPVRRRQNGLTPLELDEINVAINQAIAFIALIVAVPQHLVQVVIFLTVASLEHAAAIQLMVWNAIDPINPTNKNRLIDSFTDEQCWQHFRFRKDAMYALHARMGMPPFLTLEDGHTCPSEHALCIYLYGITNPSVLNRQQDMCHLVSFATGQVTNDATKNRWGQKEEFGGCCRCGCFHHLNCASQQS